MGTWGFGAFDNDTACDWADGLEHSSGTRLLEAALDTVVAAGADVLDYVAACEGLAAGEVVACLLGNRGPNTGYSETVDQWVADHPAQPSVRLISRALTAVDRVVADPSELKALWEDTDEAPHWYAAVAELRERISPF